MQNSDRVTDAFHNTLPVSGDTPRACSSVHAVVVNVGSSSQQSGGTGPAGPQRSSARTAAAFVKKCIFWLNLMRSSHAYIGVVVKYQSASYFMGRLFCFRVTVQYVFSTEKNKHVENNIVY